MPSFVKTTFSMRISYYLQNKIRLQILEAKIKNKYRKNEHSQRQLKENTDRLAKEIGFICRLVLYNKIKDVINTRLNGTKSILRNLKDWNLNSENMATQNFA